MSEHESLPFILSNGGFDVWLMNNRGTLFSRGHVHYDSNQLSSDYWDFTFHDMAKHDLKATISYIKSHAGREKISYVCHSQGCFQFLIGYTLYPDFLKNSIDKYGTMGNVLRITNIVIRFLPIGEDLS
jgi:lysosomal acid lipase/cholesteryl ester hydrolase